MCAIVGHNVGCSIPYKINQVAGDRSLCNVYISEGNLLETSHKLRLCYAIFFSLKYALKKSAPISILKNKYCPSELKVLWIYIVKKIKWHNILLQYVRMWWYCESW